MIVLDGKSILRVEANGLAYLDEAGNEQFIDFEKCYERYLHDKLSAERRQERNLSDSDWEAYSQRVKQFKEIGDRNTDDRYFEFHTEPLIRIEFATKDDLREIRNQIEKHGWRTFDLT